MGQPEYEIDGRDFSTLDEFFEVISRVLIPEAWWGHNLDAFNDILRGEFGTPEGGFVLRWKNSALSRERLGSFKEGVEPTVFELLVEIIRVHGAGGAEAEDGVELVLE
jgi:RNAse (barnase) inhibitor barstar